MFTYDGMKKVDCTLQDNSVVINGKFYEITNCKNITSDKTSSYSIMVLVGFLAAVTCVISYISCRNGNNSESIKIFSMNILWLTLAAVGLKCIKDEKKCISFWKINYNHMLFIESTDITNLEDILVYISSQQKSTALTIKNIIPIILAYGIIFASFIGVFILMIYCEGTKFGKLTSNLFFWSLGVYGFLGLYFYYQSTKWKNSKMVRPTRA